MLSRTMFESEDSHKHLVICKTRSNRQNLDAHKTAKSVLRFLDYLVSSTALSVLSGCSVKVLLLGDPGPSGPSGPLFTGLLGLLPLLQHTSTIFY